MSELAVVMSFLGILAASAWSGVFVAKHGPGRKRHLAVCGLAFVLLVSTAVNSGCSEAPGVSKETAVQTQIAGDKNTGNSDKQQFAENPMQEQFQAVPVLRVIDGDTVEVSYNGTPERVRLIGINTPESTIKHEPYGKEASEFTSSRLSGKTVYLEKDVSERDKYGRLLRYVWLQVPENLSESEIRNKMFNAVLLLEGYAQVATYPPDVKYFDYFLKFQREAREKEIGLWGLNAAPSQTTSVFQGFSDRAEAVYIGNSNSRKFHRPDCYWAQKIASYNRVIFKSREEAISAGYVPCKVCRP